jgi:putative hydrolase of the HAD superfamily
MSKISAVIFDLDNVLYDEKDYFYAAFDKVAAYLSNRCNIPEQKIYEKLVSDFQKKSSMYPRLFNDIIADCGLDQKLITEILELFSNIKPDLKLYPGSEKLLSALKEQKMKLGLVTNGSVTTQRNKIQLLKVEKYFDVIVYARDLGIDKDKPNPDPYKATLDMMGVKPEEAICIGDNPYTDFLGAKKLGIRTVRLQVGEFRYVRLNQEYEADLTLTSLNEIYLFLTQHTSENKF